MMAFLSATHPCLDTRLMLLVGHGNTSFNMCEGQKRRNAPLAPTLYDCLPQTQCLRHRSRSGRYAKVANPPAFLVSSFHEHEPPRHQFAQIGARLRSPTPRPAATGVRRNLPGRAGPIARRFLSRSSARGCRGRRSPFSMCSQPTATCCFSSRRQRQEQVPLRPRRAPLVRRRHPGDGPVAQFGRPRKR